MPYPTVYNVTYSYTGFQQSQGNNAFPGTQIDADLAGLQSSVSSLAFFVKGVLRPDGALNNGSVTYDSLSAALQTAGIAPADPWATGVQYPVNGPVVTNGNLYRALVAHIAGVFATDLAAGKWKFVAALPSAGVADIAGNVKRYGASGSAQTTTGTINAGTNTLTLANAIDFANGQGVLVFGAGPVPTVGMAQPASLVPINATGATTYAYRIASLDNQGGLSAAWGAFNTTVGYDALGTYLAGTTGIAMNRVTWTNGSGSPLATVVWRSTNGGAYVLLGCFTGTSIYDTGLPTQTIAGIPATPNDSAVPGWLATTISSGGGTTTLTLAANATTSVTGALVQHDDTAAINSAMAANTAVAFPAGTYNARGLQIPNTVGSVIGVGGGKSIINAIAQTADSPGFGGYGAGVVASMGNRPFYMAGMKIVAGIPMAYGGFILNQGSKANISLNEFSGAAGLHIFQSDKTQAIGNQISNWWNLGVFDSFSTDTLIASNFVGPIAAQVGAVALTDSPAGSNYQYGAGIWTTSLSSGYFISSNHIDQRGGVFGIGAHGANGSVVGNDIKHTGRESISGGQRSNYKISGNRCYWMPAGNGNLSSYDFGMSVADDGVTAVINGDISNNTIINSAFSGIGVWGYGALSSNVSVAGNTLAGVNQIGGVHTFGIEISGSNVSGINVGPNTFQSLTANTTYNVGEQDSGFGVPNNNTVSTQLGPAGASGAINLLGAGSRGPFADGVLEFTRRSANFNTAADQAIAISLPTGYTRYQIQRIIVSHPSISMTTAVGGIYTAAAKGGVAVVPASQAYSGLTTTAENTNGNLLNVTVTNGNTMSFNAATLYLSLTTPQGAAATADVSVFIQPLP